MACIQEDRQQILQAAGRQGVGDLEGVRREDVDALVNIRAGQDSGFFFLQPSVDALTYAGNNGIDVVNMSYYIDPWLYNCAANPADSAELQMEQRTIIAATNRALDYANRHGVTLIAAEGNENTDLGHPTFDPTSPDYPPNTQYDRNVDNSCLTMPGEGHHVISIGSVGPSTMKADSNWGLERTDVTAPGGFFRDFAGTPQNRTVGNLILSAYPQSLAIENGDLNPDGTPIHSSCATATARPARTTSTCRGRRWRHRTPWASRRSSSASSVIPLAASRRASWG